MITLNLSGTETSRSQAATVWAAAVISPQRLQRIPVQTIIVGTTGSSAAVERARTALEAAFPYLGPPATISGSGSQNAYNELQHMTDVVILASLVIAGCSLAVSVAAGLTDRKRPFSLLRLTGAPIGMLRRVVALESAVPLIIVALVSAGTGFLASGLFLRSELSESLRPPGAGYYLIVLAGLAASLGVIASTLPLLHRITGPETARNE
jgi:predicted lysophospholipase L1 biosynthesis ABC-type transport system permease subunit